MNANVKRKLTSRKLWMSIASFVTMMVVALGGTDSDAAQISALIMAGATVIGYVIGEGLADSSNSNIPESGTVMLEESKNPENK